MLFAMRPVSRYAISRQSWSHLVRQVSGSDKVDRSFGYAANFVLLLGPGADGISGRA